MTENNTPQPEPENTGQPEPAEETQDCGHDHSHDDGHSHDHGHGHHHHHNIGGELNYDELDPANRSLAEALRLSFGVMKVLMFVLVILFLFSGTRNIDSQHVAVRTLFGSVNGEPGQQVLEPGGPYFWPPEPIGRFILIPTTDQKVELVENFWPELAEGDAGRKIEDLIVRSGGLVPGRDGSLITSDKNVVHVQCSVNFKVRKEDAIAFATHIESIERARKIVEHIAEQSMIATVAQMTADEVLAGKWEVNSGTKTLQNEFMQAIRERLALIDSGITITGASIKEKMLPLQVRDAYKAVTEAGSEKTRAIETAEKEAKTKLNQAIGGNYKVFMNAIDAYELARRSGDEKAIKAADDQLKKLFSPENDQLAGEARSILNDALQYRESESQAVQSEVNALLQLLPQYEKNPSIALELEWQKARSEIFSGPRVEIMNVPNDPTKTIYLELGLNKDLRKRWQREGFELERDSSSN